MLANIGSVRITSYANVNWRYIMTFITVSHWTSDEVMSDETITEAQDRFVPMILKAGAKAVHMVRTGEKTSMVITHYSDSSTAEAAQAEIAEVRSQASSDFPMQMASAHAGEVTASGGG